MKAHSGGRWQLQAVARGALLALPFIGLQLLQGGPPQAGGRELRARPANPPGFLFVVTSTGDGDIVPPNGTVCDDGTGHCTLRAAIEAANNTSGTDDTIQFSIPTTDPGYNPAPGRWTINLTRALPDLSRNINIEGLGADKLIVRRDTGGNYSIFNVTTTGVVSLSGLTITNGSSVYYGGGIDNSGLVNVTNCTVSSNSAVSGGGIGNSGGTVNVTNCTLSGNFGYGPFAGGGGIANSGTVNVTNCTIGGNSAIHGVGGGISSSAGIVNIASSTISANTGGGIANSVPSGNTSTVSITSSTISNNSGGISGGGSGGIENLSYGGSSTVNVTNCTISGNSGFRGGGIENLSGGGSSTVNVTNSSISGNTTSPFGGLDGGSGGGIYQNYSFGGSGSGSVSIRSTIVALNTATSSGPDVFGDFMSQGYNLIGKTDGSTGFTQPTDLTGTIASPLDPKLDPNGLQDNGGPTKTIALLPGSLAIDAADDVNAPPRDQRGYVRLDVADIGAFEFGGLISVTLANISTRAFVQTGDNVMIGGVIITGSGQKKVILRAIGPSLVNFGLPNPLQDPTLELHDHTGAVIAFNDNWMDAPNKQAIIDSGLAPSNNLESAILTTLDPGNYTAIVRGVNNGTGIALVEGYDLDRTAGSKLGNISTRALVQTGDNVMIGGFIITGPDSDRVIARAIGPSLAQYGITNPLLDPTLELHDVNGTVIGFNDNWMDAPNRQEIIDSGLAPSNNLESAILTSLSPGNYTAIVRGVNGGTGVALVEAYGLN